MADEGEKGVLSRPLKPTRIVGALVLVAAVLYALVLMASNDYVPVSVKRAACLSNLKDIGQAMFLYASDHDFLYPPTTWMDALKPVVRGGEDGLRCPAVPRDDKPVFGYAYSASQAGKFIVFANDPKTTPLVFDSTLLVRNAVGDLTTLPHPRRHGGNCLLYADGHAKAVK